MNEHETRLIKLVEIQITDEQVTSHSGDDVQLIHVEPDQYSGQLTPLAEVDGEEDDSYHYEKRARTTTLRHTRISPISSPHSRSSADEDKDDTITYERHFNIKQHRYSNSVGDFVGCLPDSKENSPRVFEYLPKPHPPPQVILQLSSSQEGNSTDAIQGKSKRTESLEHATSNSMHPVDQSSPEIMQTSMENVTPSQTQPEYSDENSSNPAYSASSFKHMPEEGEHDKQQLRIAFQGEEGDLQMERVECHVEEDEEVKSLIQLSSKQESTPDHQSDTLLQRYSQSSQRKQGSSDKKQLILLEPIPYEQPASEATVFQALEELKLSILSSPQHYAQQEVMLSPQRDQVRYSNSQPRVQLTTLAKTTVERQSSTLSPPSRSLSSSKKFIDFIHRMRESELKRKLHIECLKLEKEHEEMKEVRKSPSILYTGRKEPNLRGNYFMSFYEQKMQQALESRQKLESQRAQNHSNCLKEVTGRPNISFKASLLPRRGVESLLQWEEQRNKKREERFREHCRTMLSDINNHLAKSGHYMAKGSNKYLSSKENLNSIVTVEERLIKSGVSKFAKREQQAQIKELQIMQRANALHQQVKNPQKFVKIEKEPVRLDERQLIKIQLSKQRQEFCQKYLSMKQKEQTFQTFGRVDALSEQTQRGSNRDKQSVYMSFGRPDSSTAQHSLQQEVLSLSGQKQVYLNTDALGSLQGSGQKYFISPENNVQITKSSSASRNHEIYSPPPKQHLDFSKVKLTPPAFVALIPPSEDVSNASSHAMDVYRQLKEEAASFNVTEIAIPSKNPSPHHPQQLYYRPHSPRDDPYGWNIPHMTPLDEVYSSPPSEQNYQSRQISPPPFSTAAQQRNLAVPLSNRPTSAKKQQQFYERNKQWEKDKRQKIDQQRSMALMKMMQYQSR